MAAQRLKVVAQPDTFHRIARARPLSAIAELIWNSLDADATEVTVYFDETDIALNAIVIEDNGVGATPDEAKDFFGKLGGSWKKPGARTKTHGRVLHGNLGQGRYKALSVGRSVSWKFFYESDGSIYEFTLDVLSDDPSEVRTSEPVPSSRTMTGCIVKIGEPHKQFRNLDGEQAASELTELFAMYLADYPDIVINYGSHRLDPTNAISNQFVLPIPPEVASDGQSAPAGKLRVIEWKHLSKRNLYICDSQGFAAQQVPAKFSFKQFSFSAYLSSPYLDILGDQNLLDLADLDPLAAEVIQSAKSLLKEHYDGEAKKEAARMIADWKSSDIYPYRDKPKNSVEEAERQVFEIVAVKIQSANAELAGAPKAAKALQLELLRHAIETGPNQLRELLAKVVDLPKHEQDDLAALLEETTLSSIIGAAKVVTDRLNFLRGLYQTVYEYKKDGRIKERTQLHRILVNNPWIFGEEFAVSTDDRDLTAVLKAHRQHLDDDLVIDEPVKHIDQTRGVVDLMLSRLLRRYRKNEVEHLVVELKRPGVPVGEKEIAQIKKYAASIENDGRFSIRNGIVWHFWVVSDSLDKYGKYEVEADTTGQGLVRNTATVKIHVVTWDQLIEDNKARYQFIQERLNFSANDERAMQFLRKEYAALLEGVVVSSDERK
ncbi:ATP-binding protein [Microvirga makkahensis]|uniref:Histidine kinase-, DNA gyrase B-, and HSP90-like ATPase n=1 Tax=Microvirga makkahensis TaxID=1128670 RepID=A0A7X3MPS6_9HYPH|nr:ATP-binding protein [Microvirga makkahensis]MXQ10943.1 hypothetical protein [Microvirga makkahensis]